MNKSHLLRGTAASLVIAISAIASAQKSSIGLGLEAGFYFPTGSILRDAFGSAIPHFGIGFVGTDRPRSGSLAPEVDIIGATKNGNRFLLIPVTVGYEQHFGDNPESIPYARASIGGAYYNYDIETSPGVEANSSRFGLAGGVEVGIILSHRVRLAAKYAIFGRQDGIDFNGLQLTATLALVRF